MQKNHFYSLKLQWTGNSGTGTSDYRAYERSHSILVDGKQPILASSDPAFRGDATKHNPEELLLASISSCHMLWFLHLCADAKIVVLDYVDSPEGIMHESGEAGGKFVEVTLKPEVSVTHAADLEKLDEIHTRAHAMCFIANSVNFPVKHHGSGKVI